MRRPFLIIGCRPVVPSYSVALETWSLPRLRIAVLSDIHAARPCTDEAALARIVDMVHAEEPDIILCPGDFIASFMPFCRRLSPERAIAPLGRLTAPLGVFASLGNHDWADDPLAWQTGYRETSVARELQNAGLVLLNNAGRRVEHGCGAFWLAGVDSRQGEKTADRPRRRDDLDAALAERPGGLPTILMAHEPDGFPEFAGRIDLMLSGHTHGGQADLWGWRPMTPSIHGGRFARGQHSEAGTTMVVSAGLGYSGLPLRIRCPPEIVLVELRGTGGEGAKR